MTKGSPFDFLDSITSIQFARMGDFRPLVERVRDGSDLSEDERFFIADYLMGRAKMDKAALQKLLKFQEREEIYKFVYLTKKVWDLSQEDAISNAEDVFRLSKRAIFEALSSVRKDPEMQRRIDAFMDHLVKRMCRTEGLE